MKITLKICLLLALSGLMSASLFAKGVAMKIEQTGANPGENGTATYLFDRDNMKMEFKGAKEHTIVVFLGQESKLMFADLIKGTKTVITKDDLQKIKAMSNQAKSMQNQYMQNMPKEYLEAMKKAREKLKDLPEDQRKLAEKYMKMPKGPGEEAPDSKLTYKLVDGSVSFKNWNCKKYVGLKNKQKTEEVLTAGFSELGLSSGDFQVFDKFGEFIGNLGEDMGAKMAATFKIGSDEWEKKHGYSGVPVKTVEYQNNQVVSTSVFNEVTRLGFTKADFTLPDNLRSEKLFDKMPKMGK